MVMCQWPAWGEKVPREDRGGVWVRGRGNLSVSRSTSSVYSSASLRPKAAASKGVKKESLICSAPFSGSRNSSCPGEKLGFVNSSCAREKRKGKKRKKLIYTEYTHTFWLGLSTCLNQLHKNSCLHTYIYTYISTYRQTDRHIHMYI